MGPMSAPLSIMDAESPRTRFRWRLWVAAMSPLVFVAACSLFFFHARSTYLPLAEAASARLHWQLEAGQGEEVYRDADTTFQQAMPADVASKFFGRLRRKLGNCQYAGPVGWQINSTPAGTFIAVTYRETCSRGAGEELLTWRIGKGAASNLVKLVGMHVNSPVLLTD
jgi:hypothetical protein